MRKLLVVLLLILVAFGLESCHKSKYCQCYAIIGDETVAFGDDINVEEYTVSQLDSLPTRYKYNLFVIDHHRTCDDKEKEFSGWGQVVCEEMDPKVDYNWLTSLFNRDKNNNNNNNNNHH